MFLCALCMFHNIHCHKLLLQWRKNSVPFYSRQIMFFSHFLSNHQSEFCLMKLTLALYISILSLGAWAQPRYAVVITEFMADPSPSVGLPPYEWIEIKNISKDTIDLKGWKIGDESGISGPLPGIILFPDSLLIISSAAAVTSLRQFGPAISVSNFPSLDNDGDLIFIQNSTGNIIHGLSFSTEWYRNPKKQEGGWSLEMINPAYACLQGENWQASNAVIGGSPGKTNTVTNSIPAMTSSKYQRMYAIAPDTIVFVFDKPIDSIQASITTNFLFPPGFNAVSSMTIPPVHNSIRVVLNKAMDKTKTYPIQIRNLTDCVGTPVDTAITIKAGIAEEPDSRDCVINEVLFNPYPGGSDYVEIYNNSDKVIDLSHLSIAGRNLSGAVGSVQPVSSMPFYFFPEEYIVITEDPSSVSRFYHVKDSKRLIKLKPMPSMPDDAGDILLLNFHGEILDELKYDADWHFKLLRDLEGIAIERLDKDAITQQQSNWHSAATTAGYGTPGYKNSQHLGANDDGSPISVSPKIFSPDMDGRDDITRIDFKLNSINNVANAWIFNERGRCVKNLVRNEIVGNTGYWIWDGLDERNQPMEPGNYILITEFFNLEGKKSRYKNLLIVANRIN